MKAYADWSCLLDSYAYVLGVTTLEIIDFIGHDGSEHWWPELPEPWGRRAFHPQELLDFANHMGATVMVVEAMPVVEPQQGGVLMDVKPCGREPMDRMWDYMACHPGVLIGDDHAVAWKNNQVVDPTGDNYLISEIKMNIREFHRIDL